MDLIIHDLTEAEWDLLHLPIKENARIIDRQGNIKKCTGCFGCWVKTPGQCVIADGYQQMGELMAQSEKVLIISKCTFGSYSSFVKNVMDRSISYVLPFFEIRNGEMHHKARYQNRIRISTIFYGTDITENEKKTAKRLVEANAMNFNGIVEKVEFVDDFEKIREVIG